MRFVNIVNILYEINIKTIFNTALNFTPIVFSLCIKSMEAQWTGDNEFWYTLNGSNFKEILICCETETS